MVFTSIAILSFVLLTHMVLKSSFSTESDGDIQQTVRLALKHRASLGEKLGRNSVPNTTLRDLHRISALRRRITKRRNQRASSRHISSHRHLLEQPEETVYGSLRSGASLGSGEYFMDLMIGTPPKRFSLIVDTGSDMNWVQSVPCFDCFDQDGPHYDPGESTSFKNITCNDPRCGLVSSPDPPLRSCNKGGSGSGSCPYYYWYGDGSNTTGDFALETFTVNLTDPDGKTQYQKLENVMFGCGHWNRGHFHGAAGLLGLGRGPLSFPSQITSLYGQSFSYCLVDRNSDSTSRLTFGVDKIVLSHPELNFTSFITPNHDTFYYVQVRSINIGGETLRVPQETWDTTPDGGGGTIVDSGTTLTYFVEPAYQAIKNSFMNKIDYPVVSDFPVLSPCYNISGVDWVQIPEFQILFMDGAVWNFPVKNYFIWIDSDTICLAMLGTKRPNFSIIGNYLQQNFHVMYDTGNSRLGFAPANCADA